MDREREISSSASCRIVVVSSSIDTSREVAYRIKALSGDDSPSSSSSEVIHWTIKNKYYTAPVHFHPIHIEGLEFIELDDVPAVIYAWKGNEPYRTHMKQVSEQTLSSNPEVSLAISMTPTTDEELEDFFFEHGFEYLEGHPDRPDEEEDAGLSRSTSFTPGMRRAVDALSTIMWPSMVRMTEDGVDVNYRTLVASGMQREMEMLERWLEEEDDAQLQLQLPTKRTTTTTTTNDHDPWLPIVTGNRTDDGAIGFDDDFTEFVCAPTTCAGSSPSPHSPEGASESELPSEAEIRAVSVLIFGSSAGALSSRPLARPTSNEYASLSDTDHDHNKLEDDGSGDSKE